MIPNLLQEQFMWSPLGRNSGIELAHPSMVQFVPAQMLHCKQKIPLIRKTQDYEILHTELFSPQFNLFKSRLWKIKSHCQTSLDWSSCV